jgi:hypothetical protein
MKILLKHFLTLLPKMDWGVVKYARYDPYCFEFAVKEYSYDQCAYCLYGLLQTFIFTFNLLISILFFIYSFYITILSIIIF